MDMDNDNINIRLSPPHTSKEKRKFEIKTLKLIIQEEKYDIEDQTLIVALLPYLRKNKEYFNPTNHTFVFPSKFQAYDLELFFKLLIQKTLIDSFEFYDMRKTLNVCLYFDATDLVHLLVEKFLIPKINKDTCVDVLYNFLDLLYDDKVKDVFIDIIQEALLMVANDFGYYFENFYDKLLLLSAETIEEITELFFRSSRNCCKPSFPQDTRNILQLLMSARNIKNDIFNLLENERKRVIHSFDSIISDKNLKKPTFIWKISCDDISSEIYQEERISLESLSILLISYYDADNDTFKLALQILDVQNNTTNTASKEDSLEKDSDEPLTAQKISLKKTEDDNNEINKHNYNSYNGYKNNKNLNNIKLNTNINSNLGKNTPIKIQQILNKENINNNINNINNINNLNSINPNAMNDNSIKQSLPMANNNDLVSVLSVCEIPKINYTSRINFNCIYIQNKSRFLVFKLDNFKSRFPELKTSNALDFTLKIYFQRNYLFSPIIKHICDNFNEYNKYPSICKIPRSAMSIILKNDSQKSNDAKLKAIENWFQDKTIEQTKNSLDLFKAVDWKNVTTERLVDFFTGNPKLINVTEELKNDVFFEIQRRFQEEYSEYFQKSNLNKSNSMLNCSVSATENTNNDISNNHQNNIHSYFTLEFLTKLLNNLCKGPDQPLCTGNSLKEINFTSPVQDERNSHNPNLSLTQRNKIPKHKGSKNIMLKEYPFNMSFLKKQYSSKQPTNEDIYSRTIKQIPTNRNSKKKTSAKNSLILNYNNLSGVWGQNSYFNKTNIRSNNPTSKKASVNSSFLTKLMHKGFRSSTPDNPGFIKSPSLSIVRTNHTQYKTSHNKSLDRIIQQPKISQVPSSTNQKKNNIFPKYINNNNTSNKKGGRSQNYKNISQIKKRIPSRDVSGHNISIIPIGVTMKSQFVKGKLIGNKDENDKNVNNIRKINERNYFRYIHPRTKSTY